MIPFLIFYYIFSVLFMIGYCDFTILASEKPLAVKILSVVALIIVAPIVLPVNLGVHIHDNITVNLIKKQNKYDA